MVDVGIEPTTQKPMVLPTTPFVKVLSGVLVRLTTCNWLTDSLPKLSLITFLRRMGKYEASSRTPPQFRVFSCMQWVNLTRLYSQSSMFSGVSFSSRGSDSASCPYRLSLTVTNGICKCSTPRASHGLDHLHIIYRSSSDHLQISTSWRILQCPWQQQRYELCHSITTPSRKLPLYADA